MEGREGMSVGLGKKRGNFSEGNLSGEHGDLSRNGGKTTNIKVGGEGSKMGVKGTA